jgi:hypothetical protein
MSVLPSIKELSHMKYMKGLSGKTLIIYGPELFIVGFILGAISVGSICYGIGRYYAQIEKFWTGG